MSPEEFAILKPGDIVKHTGKVGGLDAYVVTANYGGRITAVRSIDMTNPPEWEKVELK